MTPHADTSSSKPSKGKGKEGENTILEGENVIFHVRQSSSDEHEELKHEINPQSKKMEELEYCLNDMVNRSELQKGIVRPYPVEWDTIPYLHKFKVPTLFHVDGTSSPNQHMYHF